MNGKNSKIPIALIISLFLYFVAGIAFQLFVNTDFLFFNGFWMGTLLNLLLLVFAIFANLFIHELGHLIFGLISGYEFVSFRVLNLILIKTKQGYRLRKYSLAGTAGQCLMSPPNNREKDMPVALYNLGGSLLNVIVSIALLLVSLTVDNVMLTALLETIAIFGFMFALINGIPMKSMIANDGYNALSLRKDNSSREAFLRTLKMNEFLINGARLKDMPDEWFVFPDSSKMQNTHTASLAVNACCRLMDMHKFAEADKLMEELLNSENAILPIHRNLMICDRIYCEIVSENRGSVIDAMRTKEIRKFMLSMQNSISVARTLYLCALLTDRNFEEAEKYRKKFEKIIANHPYSGDVESERELVEIAKDKVK